MQHPRTIVKHEELSNSSEEGGRVEDVGAVLQTHLEQAKICQSQGKFYVSKEVTCYVPLDHEGFNEWL